MQTYKINVSAGRDKVNEIRLELFNFPEVLDVFVTGRPDSLVVVFWGRSRPGEWLRALRAVGYEVPRRRPSHPPRSEADQTGLSVASDRAPAGRLVTGATKRTGERQRKVIKKPLSRQAAAAHRH